MPRKLIVAAFADEEQFLDATRAARDKNLHIYDTYTPYAVHGLQEAMGLPRTRIAIVCFLMGLAGLITALSFQLWSLGLDWPMNIGGKTHTALPALIPVAFEMTVLFASVGVVVTFFLYVRLWPGREATLLHPGITDDRFVLAIEDNGQDSAPVRQLFEDHNAADINHVEVER